MNILIVYIVLFVLTFIGGGVSLMISEGYLKNVLIISFFNIFFFLSVLIYRITARLAKRKMRRDFNIKPDEEDGMYHYKLSYWKAYGGNAEENTTWNTFVNNLKVLFRKREEVAE